MRGRGPAERALGVHRVLEPAGVLPQAARRLDARPDDLARRGADRGRAAQPRRRVLPAARARPHGGDGAAVRAAVLDIIATRGKVQNPVTGSGGMLVGTVREVGPQSPARPGGRRPGGDPGLAVPHAAAGSPTAWPAGTGTASRCRPEGDAILFGRSIAAVIPDDLFDPRLSLMVMDVCGAPALPPRGCVERTGAPVGRRPGRAPASPGSPGARRRPRAPGRPRLIGLVRDERRGRRADAAGPGRPRRRRRRHATRWPSARRRSADAGRHHRRLRRRARRASTAPILATADGRHRGLLLHGDVVHRRRRSVRRAWRRT